MQLLGPIIIMISLGVDGQGLPPAGASFDHTLPPDTPHIPLDSSYSSIWGAEYLQGGPKGRGHVTGGGAC